MRSARRSCFRVRRRDLRDLRPLGRARPSTTTPRADRARVTYSPGDRQWVDHAGVGTTDLLDLAYTPRSITPIHLFWNQLCATSSCCLTPRRPTPSGSPVAHRGGRHLLKARPPDPSAGARGGIPRQGVAPARTAGEHHPDVDPVAADRKRAASRGSTKGRYFDGWLSARAASPSGPTRRVGCRDAQALAVSLEPDQATSVLLSAPGFKRTVQFAGGSRSTVNVPVHASSAWTLSSRAPGLRFLPDGADGLRPEPAAGLRAHTGPQGARHICR